MFGGHPIGPGPYGPGGPIPIGPGPGGPPIIGGGYKRFFMIR